MTTLRTLATAAGVTLVMLTAVPAFAATTDDTQAPRGRTTEINATLDDTQAPRSQDTRATLDDTQAPRGQDTRATLDDTQAPRGQDSQAPRAPRS
jgi:hypothetical protein